jgi:hypothetical protein
MPSMKARNAGGVKFLSPTLVCETFSLKDVRSRLVSIVIVMPGLHTASVNHFVQIGAYDNQEENY